MIKEEYVSFETAKLLKEKKALIDYTMGYDKDGDLCNAMKCGVIDGKRVCILNGKDNLLMAPTQSMAMRWLREVHNIYIMVEHNKLLTPPFWFKLDDYTSDSLYTTYEQACEAAIKYCLENLI